MRAPIGVGDDGRGPFAKVGIVYGRLRFFDFAQNDIWGGPGVTGNGRRG